MIISPNPPRTPKEWQEWQRLRILDELHEAGIAIMRENINQIIDETSFQARSQKYPSLCPCYSEGKPGHDKPGIDDFSCFLCACPNYNLEGTGSCNIHGGRGEDYIIDLIPEGKVWDCSGCNFGHFYIQARKCIETHLSELAEQARELEKER